MLYKDLCFRLLLRYGSRGDCFLPILTFPASQTGDSWLSVLFCMFVCLFELKAAGEKEDVKEDKVWLHIWPPPLSAPSHPSHLCFTASCDCKHQIKPLYDPSRTETGKLSPEPTAELFASRGGGTVCCYKSNLGSLPVNQRREEDWAVVSVARGRMCHAGEFSHYCQELLKFANKNTVFQIVVIQARRRARPRPKTTQPRPNLSAPGPSLTHAHVCSASC